MSGHVYFAECAGQIKVGFATNVPARLRQISKGHVAPLSLIGHIEGSKHLERAIHARLAEHRNNGEWFTGNSEVRGVVADLMDRGACAIDFKEPVTSETVAQSDEQQSAAARQLPRSLAQAYLQISNAYADLAGFLLGETEL